MHKHPYVVAFLGMLLGSAAVLAQSPPVEQALARTHQDAGLTWAPCPEGFPMGCAIAVLHGDPAKDNADLLFRVPAGARIPAHWHTSAERMVLLSGEMEVAYEGQQATTLKPGTYAYGPAKRTHKAHCTGDVPCVLFIAFESPVDAVLVDGAAK
ncbi:cupin [Lysobacter daejeonensis GH1-9]|uniref:Cupin n=1 Tax=Lysobacter daejeonensis GH1-9 TaxID=1385517 RepID=A0A0A0EX99_9GAMM|nr:cupin domain-containing protein [Lysobacter daejeonensis]KGM55571.1 cupin [Lysobacter daejeonensis GH1-9]